MLIVQSFLQFSVQCLSLDISDENVISNYPPYNYQSLTITESSLLKPFHELANLPLAES